MNRMRPIPQIPYDKFKGYLCEHMWLHYMFHSTYCAAKEVLNKRYIPYTPRQWKERLDKCESER
jgi:hypothetical protein